MEIPPLFINSFNKHSLCAYYVSGTLLGDRIDICGHILCLQRIYNRWEDTDDKERDQIIDQVNFRE